MDRRELAFILALVGGILSIGGAVMMGLMMMAMFGFAFGMRGGGFFPASFMGLFFGWMLVLGIAGGIVMLVGAPRLRRPGQERSGATWALAGGIISLVAGNVLAGALGIVGGALLLLESSASPSRG